MYNLEKFNWTDVPNEDWKCTNVKKNFLLLIDNVMNTKSELIFLNKRVSHIPLLFDFEKLDNINKQRVNILKSHIFKSHKIITNMLEIQIIDNILITNQKGFIDKSDNICEARIDGIVALILNKFKITKIEK